MEYSARDKAVIWHPYTQMKTSPEAITIVKGQGPYLYDAYGKEYIDAVSSWWVNLHGHANPYIAEKIHAQLLTLEHVIFAGFTHPSAIELAERLLPLLPGNQDKIFYSDNGSTAVEVAIKMAIQYNYNKEKKANTIIAFENAYHGDTFGAMSISARGAFTNPFKELLFDIITIPPPTNNGNSLQLLSKLIQEKKNNIAAFIFEPLIQGAGGMLMYEASALDELIQLCKRHNIICIADEVMTGFGRTGKLFASDYLCESPDIICLSKGITGGTMAFGVTACKNFIYDAFLSEDKLKTFFHGHSYTANPIACAASLASLDLLLSEDCQKAIQIIQSQNKDFAEQLKTYSGVEHVRYLGTILAFDIKTEENNNYFNSIRDEWYHHFLNEGILLRPLGNTIYIMPPYIISTEDLQKVYRSILKKLKEIPSSLLTK